MNFIENLIYGFISGITEFLPISSSAHQEMFRTIFGGNIYDPVQNLFIHIAVFLAVYTATTNIRTQISRASGGSSKVVGRQTASLAKMEARLLRNATIPYIITFLILQYIMQGKSSLLMIAAFLFLNSIVIFLRDRVLQGNKNAKVMSGFDGILLGAISALSAFPGISRIGFLASTAALRGAGRKDAIKWCLLLSIPALIIWIFCDLLSIFGGLTVPFWSNILSYIFAAIFAYTGARISIYILRKLISKSGYTGYAYYSFGAALFSLILFLTVA